MQISLLLSENEVGKKMGLLLKKARLKSNQTLAELGARIGVSRWTVAQMEKGNPNVSLAAWIKVSSLLGLLDTWQGVLQPPEDPFAAFDRAREEEARLIKARVGKKKKPA